MRKANGKKGIALIMTLATVLIVAVLANIILTVIASNYKLTHHKTSRIKAYYAGLAAMNLTMDKIRRGGWAADKAVAFSSNLCKSGCTGPFDVNDPDIPYNAAISISAEETNPDLPNYGLRTINLSVTYDD